MRKPVVLKAAKTQFQNLVTGAEKFFVRVKKTAAATTCHMGRVSDPLATTHAEWMCQTMDRLFHQNNFKHQMITANNLPAALKEKADVVTSFASSFLCSGPHHEATHFEFHMIGSIRVSISGSRTLAARDFSLWSTFVRSMHSGHTGQNTDASGKTFTSLGSQSTTVSPLQVRQMFRNLNSDRNVN